MHIVNNCSNARSYGYRGRYTFTCNSTGSFDHQIEHDRKPCSGQTIPRKQPWRPFRYGNQKNQIHQNIYASGVPSLQTICLQLLQKCIVSVAEVSWYMTESSQQSKQPDMTEATEYLTSQVLCKVPPVYVDEVCNTIIDCIEYLLSNVTLAQCFIDVLLHANLKKLDLSGRPRELQRALYPSLEGLTKLELLAIKRNRHESVFYQYPIEGLVLKGVKKMTNLESFTFHDRCTDSIILALVQHCPRLRSINVFASEKVTNVCAKHLAKCQRLSEVNFSETSVTDNGFAQILLSCPNITDIGSFKQIWDAISKVRRREVTLNLTTVKERLDCNRQLCLIDTCPKLTYLHLDCFDFDGQILAIEGLRDLQELTIDNADFHRNGIGDYLKLSGERLENLTLRDCTGADVNWIKSTCPNLKSLEFFKVPVNVQATWNLSNKRRRFKHWDDVVLLLIICLVFAALTMSFIWLGRL